MSLNLKEFVKTLEKAIDDPPIHGYVDAAADAYRRGWNDAIKSVLLVLKEKAL